MGSVKARPIFRKRSDKSLPLARCGRKVNFFCRAIRLPASLCSMGSGFWDFTLSITESRFKPVNFAIRPSSSPGSAQRSSYRTRITLLGRKSRTPSHRRLPTTQLSALIPRMKGANFSLWNVRRNRTSPLPSRRRCRLEASICSGFRTM